jgi:hypothetical protein
MDRVVLSIKDILCCKDISEKEAKYGYLMVSTGFFGLMKVALAPTYLHIKWLLECFDI